MHTTNQYASKHEVIYFQPILNFKEIKYQLIDCTRWNCFTAAEAKQVMHVSIENKLDY